MTADLGLNLAGVERVLDLEAEIEGMHARIEELELAGAARAGRLAEQLEEVRRSFRAELVPYRGATDLVRAADARQAFPPTRRRRNDGSLAAHRRHSRPSPRRSRARWSASDAT